MEEGSSSGLSPGRNMHARSGIGCMSATRDEAHGFVAGGPWPSSGADHSPSSCAAGCSRASAESDHESAPSGRGRDVSPGERH